MIKKGLATLLLILICKFSFATHNRAGYIRYTLVPNTKFTYQVTIITYTKASSIGADRDSLPIVWGDGLGDTLPRTNGFGKGILLGYNIKYNEYTGIHTYPGFGQYVVSMTDPNRIEDILNMNTSVDVPFYIEDTLNIPDPAFYLGYNNSPIISKAPVDFAEKDQLFIYNPAASDPDGDSLSYKLVPPKRAQGVDVPGYLDPNKIQFTSPNRTFTLNPLTGEVRWFTPQFCGIYNIAILITEWRRVKGASKSLYAKDVGTTILDMEIIVTCNTDLPPKIAALHDTCVIAGTTLKYFVRATDPDAGQQVLLSAVGGPFDVPVSPATFTDIPGTANTNYIAKGTFTWATTCDHINGLPYQVVFTALDRLAPPDSLESPLTDVQAWNIKVVAPPPQNLKANASGNSIILTWDNPYSCSGLTKFIGFSIWRKEGCDSFNVDTCETGLDGKGFTKLADRWRSYSYNDNTVQRGTDYAYRIFAEFADTNNFRLAVNYVASLPSNQSCASLKKDIPVITNVSIRNTDTNNGSVYVAWSKPDGTILDTVQNPGPYKYVVFHGTNPGSLTSIQTFSSPTFYGLADSTFIDTPVNTVASAVWYKVQFFSDTNKIGETEVASSVFLTIQSASHRLILSWKETVPWNNDSYSIFRKNLAGTWDSIGVTSSHSYTDAHLINDTNYCYYVRSHGNYSVTGFVSPIINLSERVCAVPLDTVGPCPPALAINNTCNTPNFSLGDYVNQLHWNKPGGDCAADLLKYRIYFAPTVNGPFQLIDSTHFVNDTLFNHTLANSIAGCYAISGVDSTYNEGPRSQPVCVDNCPVYNLPNVFTPNGDDKNDLFHPTLPFRYIDRIDIKIYDSWGLLVFQTTDPVINWDGKDMNSHKALPQGTYYYVCDVFESHPSGDIKRSKPLEGFIHLYR